MAEFPPGFSGLGKIAGRPVWWPTSPARIFGNFLEHPGFAIYGGVWAQVLSNPGFERDANLSRRSLHQLERAGRYLTDFFVSRRNPRSLPPRWTPGTGATGFGVTTTASRPARRLSRGLPSLTGTRSAPRLITICL